MEREMSGHPEELGMSHPLEERLSQIMSNNPLSGENLLERIIKIEKRLKKLEESIDEPS